MPIRADNNKQPTKQFMVIVPMMPLIDDSMCSIYNLCVLENGKLNAEIFSIDFLSHSSFLCRAVVRELIETEEEFGRDLMRVVDKYIKTVENSKPPKIITDNKDLIFGNFKQITEFHNTLVSRNPKFHLILLIS